MRRCCSGGSEGDEIRRSGGALRVADALALAASPTFALMALLTGVRGEMAGMGAHVSSMSGMVTMYLLMSAFHLTAWLKLNRSADPLSRAAPAAMMCDGQD